MVVQVTRLPNPAGQVGAKQGHVLAGATGNLQRPALRWQQLLQARKYGVAALNRALEGVKGITAVHICFGYAAIIHERPTGYTFLHELAATAVNQISIETAQSNLDCSVLEQLPNKKIILGCIDLSDMNIESPVLIASRVKKALKFVAAENIVLAPDCGMKYLPREVANGKLKAMVQAAQMLRSELT